MESTVVNDEQFMKDLEAGKSSFSDSGNSSDAKTESTLRNSPTIDSHCQRESVISQVKV